jgi:hypothetical protein
VKPKPGEPRFPYSGKIVEINKNKHFIVELDGGLQCPRPIRPRELKKAKGKWRDMLVVYLRMRRYGSF